ncbi:hypothetical protein HSX37_14375|uniref:Uncharacterized protein n=1 Tax=Dendrosporobacter quercicolus TaxID=146817 RepID=A0A1G9WVI9_9FIRM|nr:hypothetical protein [Dendrosporobacter quercicolus]NSL49218.1 hypothetical protein [Dendrosporobacter quercicolus DSM 1736]SDM88166.1 hypothetical protein SAMN04488502_10894 [Dendrosporobacter quercicolus]
MDILLTNIEELQNAIFAYEQEQFTNQFVKLTDLLIAGMQGLSIQDQAILNPVLNAVLTSYEQRDYLLLADLLEYELKPLLTV